MIDDELEATWALMERMFPAGWVFDGLDREEDRGSLPWTAWAEHFDDPYDRIGSDGETPAAALRALAKALAGLP